MTLASTEPGALQVSGLSVAAGSLQLVKAVSFSAQPTQITAIIGPNGAGKTTLLEAIVGLRPGSTGSVRVAGRALRSFRERAAQFAYLPDQSQLAPELSVRALVGHAERCARSSPYSSQIAALLAIADLMHRAVGVLSQGECKRLQIFCTLLLGRPFVVLDEPLSAFDPFQLKDVFRAIRIAADAGAAVIATIHQLTDAERIADKILLLAAGRASAFGSLSELRATVGDAEASLEQIFLSLLSQGRHVA